MSAWYRDFILQYEPGKSNHFKRSLTLPSLSKILDRPLKPYFLNTNQGGDKVKIQFHIEASLHIQLPHPNIFPRSIHLSSKDKIRLPMNSSYQTKNLHLHLKSQTRSPSTHDPMKPTICCY